MKWLLRFVLAIAAMAAAVPVLASSDSTCYPTWKVKQTALDGCSNSALISPGNDTRVNLLMLLFDRHGSVGVSHVPDYDYYDGGERRGEARPFNYPVFALTLGPQKKDAAGEADEDNSAAATRCGTNDAGAQAFIAALGKAADIPADERAALSAARTALKPECNEGEKAREIAAQNVALVKSKSGRAFANYLVGAAAFYDGDFVTAETSFAGLSKASSPWLTSTASYMLGRVALNQAMVSAFDEYGSLNDKAIDKQALLNAEGAFLGYLKAYPAGEYAVSARGLLRKVYWLGQDKQKLIAAYAAQFALKDPGQRNVSFADMVQEADIKVLDNLDIANVSDPVLLAILDLKAMRHGDDPAESTSNNAPITRAALDAQRSRFAGNEALYNYVLAAHAFYVADDPKDTLALLNGASGRDADSYLGYSRKLLRALALDGARDASARSALIALVSAAKLPFQRGVAEVALAMHLERAKALDLVFASGSPIHEADVREILLRYAAGPALLRSRAISNTAPDRERKVALFALLYKQLTRGSYGDFTRDVALIPANAKPIAPEDYDTPSYVNVAIFKWDGSKDFVCPPIRNVATALTATPKDATSLLCLGEFARLNNLDPDFYGVQHFLDDSPAKDELGGMPSQFPGKPFSRGEIYKNLIADPKVAAPNKAYALYRAVRCYAPSAYNSCGGTDVNIGIRKAWFRRLKGEFASSPWAKKLDFYW